MPVTSDDIVDAVMEILKTIKEIIPKLQDISEEMENFQDHRMTTKFLGTSVTVIGAVFGVTAAFATGGLSLLPAIYYTAVGAVANTTASVADSIKTKKCKKKIAKMLENLNDQMENLQKLVEEFNKQVEESMSTYNLDRNTVAVIHFASSNYCNVVPLLYLATSELLRTPIAMLIVKMPECISIVSKTFGVLMVDVAEILLQCGGKSAYITCAATGSSLTEAGSALGASLETGSASVAGAVGTSVASVAKVIGKCAAVAGVGVALYDVVLLMKNFTIDHPTMKTIDDTIEKLKNLKTVFKTGLEEQMKLSAAAKEAATEIIATFCTQTLGGGYNISSNSEIIPLTFSEFVNQIGRGTEGGIFHLKFLSEMLGQTIEIFDKTSDRSLQKQYGTNHLKVDPFNLTSSATIRIVKTGREGSYHYSPLLADGTPIFIEPGSQYNNRCLFDAIAHQLCISNGTLIARLQAYLKNDSVAEELYEQNIQEIFPEFNGGARRPRPDTPNGNYACIIRTVQGNKEIVTATVRYENLYRGSVATDSVRNETLNNGYRICDHTGHVLAKVLGGVGNIAENFEPMHRCLNLGEFKSFELQIKKVLEKNPAWRADITVEMTYDLESEKPRRPTSFEYTVEFFDANGKLVFERNKFFKNYFS